MKDKFYRNTNATLKYRGMSPDPYAIEYEGTEFDYWKVEDQFFDIFLDENKISDDKFCIKDFDRFNDWMNSGEGTKRITDAFDKAIEYKRMKEKKQKGVRFPLCKAKPYLNLLCA